MYPVSKNGVENYLQLKSVNEVDRKRNLCPAISFMEKDIAGQRFFFLKFYIYRISGMK